MTVQNKLSKYKMSIKTNVSVLHLEPNNLTRNNNIKKPVNNIEQISQTGNWFCSTYSDGLLTLNNFNNSSTFLNLKLVSNLDCFTNLLSTILPFTQAAYFSLFFPACNFLAFSQNFLNFVRFSCSYVEIYKH